MKSRSLLTMVFLAFVFVGASPMGDSQAASASLEQRHSKQGISCKQCHGDKPKEEQVSMETCLGCHGSYQKLAEASKAKTPNPHDSHIGEIRCSLCHHVHKDSEMYCNKCHQFNLDFPK